MSKIRRKRPCCICHHWFLPNPKVKKRQVTCGDLQCQKQWHKRQCAKWNRKNADYFRSNYLQNKLDKAKKNNQLPPATESDRDNKIRPSPPSFQNLPIQPIKEVVEIELLIVIDYVIKIQIFRFQKAVMKRRIVNKGSPFH